MSSWSTADPKTHNHKTILLYDFPWPDMHSSSLITQRTKIQSLKPNILIQIGERIHDVRKAMSDYWTCSRRGSTDLSLMNFNKTVWYGFLEELMSFVLLQNRLDMKKCDSVEKTTREALFWKIEILLYSFNFPYCPGAMIRIQREIKFMAEDRP